MNIITKEIHVVYLIGNRKMVDPKGEQRFLRPEDWITPAIFYPNTHPQGEGRHGKPKNKRAIDIKASRREKKNLRLLRLKAEDLDSLIERREEWSH